MTLQTLAQRIAAGPSMLDDSALREALLHLGLAVERWFAARLGAPNAHFVAIAFDRRSSSAPVRTASGSFALGQTMLTGAAGGLSRNRYVSSRLRLLARYRGIEIDTAGDGFFASFDERARAVRCAMAITEGVRPLGIQARAALHTGEVERVGRLLVLGRSAAPALVHCSTFAGEGHPPPVRPPSGPGIVQRPGTPHSGPSAHRIDYKKVLRLRDVRRTRDGRPQPRHLQGLNPGVQTSTSLPGHPDDFVR